MLLLHLLLYLHKLPVNQFNWYIKINAIGNLTGVNSRYIPSHKFKVHNLILNLNLIILLIWTRRGIIILISTHGSTTAPTNVVLLINLLCLLLFSHHMDQILIIGKGYLVLNLTHYFNLKEHLHHTFINWKTLHHPLTLQAFLRCFYYWFNNLIINQKRVETHVLLDQIDWLMIIWGTDF